MAENKNEKITREEDSRAMEITRILSRLPEKKQEKIYYLVKCAELFESYGKSDAPRAAAL